MCTKLMNTSVCLDLSGRPLSDKYLQYAQQIPFKQINMFEIMTTRVTMIDKTYINFVHTFYSQVIDKFAILSKQV